MFNANTIRGFQGIEKPKRNTLCSAVFGLITVFLVQASQ
jgi:hypothetical protein